MSVRGLAGVVLMVLATVGLAIPAAIALTPLQGTTVAGQYVEVGATTPDWGWFGGLSGPAQLEQIGHTTVDLRQIDVRGPLRPKIALGPLVHNEAADELLDPKEGPKARAEGRAAVAGAFRNWYLLATALLVLIALAIVAVVTSARLWLLMRRTTRTQAHLTVGEAWHASARGVRRVAAVTLVATLATWLAVGALARHDATTGLEGVRSIRDLVGAAPVKLRPAGPSASGYTGAVIGDSRASRLGGPPVADPGPGDVACERSADSLAAQLTSLQPGDRFLNLACPSATIRHGLLGPQSQGGVRLPAQVSRLLRMEDLRYVVVMIGPNDLAWSDFLRYCYGLSECDDRFADSQFDYRLARFDRDYGDLLAALAALPTHPQVIVVASYDAFAPGADCSDTSADGRPPISTTSLELLQERNDELNDVLTAGAEAYDFTVATPRLTPLCASGDRLGADLQGLDDDYPFHPTALGMVRLAASALTAIDPGAPDGSGATETGTSATD